MDFAGHFPMVFQWHLPMGFHACEILRVIISCTSMVSYLIAVLFSYHSSSIWLGHCMPCAESCCVLHRQFCFRPCLQVCLPTSISRRCCFHWQQKRKVYICIHTYIYIYIYTYEHVFLFSFEQTHPR